MANTRSAKKATRKIATRTAVNRNRRSRMRTFLRKIEEAMHRLIAGRTVFAIAHRLSTLRRADRIFVIEEGAITECGTHDQLLRKVGGTYRKLHEMQREMQVPARTQEEGYRG